jgi:hypothetical protein
MIIEELARIQKDLKAPKGNFNSFGKYKYRSCEDILEAVKPILNGCVLTLTDEIENIGDRYYIKATVTLLGTDNSISVSAYARESLDKKGMDDSQITGTASSYARKYALNGLFCIDDTKDADATNTHGKTEDTEEEKEIVQKARTTKIDAIKIKSLETLAQEKGKTVDQLEAVSKALFKKSHKDINTLEYVTLIERLEKL